MAETQQVVQNYEQFPQPKPARQQTYFRFSFIQPVSQELELDEIELSTLNSTIPKQLPSEPVYVTKDTNQLVYNSGMMEKGKQYFVTWCKEHFLLIRTDDGVAVYRFEADENGTGD